MKKLLRGQLAVGLCLSMMVPLCRQVFAQSADINIKVKVTTPPPPGPSGPDPCAKYEEGQQASESIRLYYLRSAGTIQKILTEFVKVNDCLEGTGIEAQDENVIVLYGTKKRREELARIIGILDLPREGVKLQMWGILISSNNPQQLAEVLRKVNREIDRTQQLLQETYRALEDYAREIPPDPKFQKLFEEQLGFRGALDEERSPLSMSDILLRINAAVEPITYYNASAKNLCRLFSQDKYKIYTEALKKDGKIPFGNFIEFGLHQDKEKSQAPLATCEGNIEIGDTKVLRENFRRRRAVLDFALQYSYLANKPEEFDPRALQQAAENLNTLLNPLIGAINRDVEELFIEPTLARIQSIVREYKDVEYAEVGKTSVASLNGIKSEVSSTTVSAFDETGPLRLNELLTDASAINSSIGDLLPSGAASGAATAGAQAFPYTAAISLAAALSKDRSLWRELTSGVSLEITPSVLRNSSSAELDIEFITGPKEAGTQQEGVRPLSRISQNTVKTKVYVNTLDIFPLSTFNSQTTIDGGRSYIPIIGTVWKGIFSGLPIVGNLFSWKNDPKNVQHQSIVLTNSFIVPTAMGLAPLYQPPSSNSESSNSEQSSKYNYYYPCLAVEEYKNALRNQIPERKTENEGEQSSQERIYTARQPNTLDTNEIQAICGKPPENKTQSKK